MSYKSSQLSPRVQSALGVKRLRSQVRKGMNKLEAAFVAYWKLQTGNLGQTLEYEPVKLRLADNTFYTPDFVTVRPIDRTEYGMAAVTTYYEVKGFMRDDASVKIKVARRLFPHARFVLAMRIKGQWVFDG